jgi:dephospho-CoA kinase
MIGVAISGRAGAGKTTLASHLVNYGYTRVAFGDAIKAEVLKLYGLTKHDPGGREKLIEHGDARRLADPDHWIRPVADRVRLAQVCDCHVVIDDLRFARELEWARSLGFIIVRIDAPLELRRERLAAQGLDPDFAKANGPGETELERIPYHWDEYVFNSGDGVCRAAAARITDQAVALALSASLRSAA